MTPDLDRARIKLKRIRPNIPEVQDRVAKRVRAKPQPFTVVSNQTVRVDMNIFTGFGISH